MQTDGPRDPDSILISCRGGCSDAETHRLYDQISTYFHGVSVLPDPPCIDTAPDYRQFPNRALGGCKVLLVIMDPDWATCIGEDGARRLHSPDDPARMVIAAALKKGIAVQTVLVSGAAMPSEDDLPDDLGALAYLQAHFLRCDHWEDDVFELQRYLDRIIPVRRRAKALVDAFEFGKSSRYVYFRVFRKGQYPYDEIEYGRSFASLHRGSLYELVRRYCGFPGARFADSLKACLPQLKDKDPALLDDKSLEGLLTGAAIEDPEMLHAQDSQWDSDFWAPSLREANTIHIMTPLGLAIVFDTVVHTGHAAWRRLKDRATRQVGGNPATGVPEQEWLHTLLEQRRDLLKTRYPATEKRAGELLRLAAEGNWHLEPPTQVFDRPIVTDRNHPPTDSGECIFISYRRSDAADEAQRLHDDLSTYFGPLGVFRDRSDIGLGLDYSETLKAALRKCELMLAVIGPTWLTCCSEGGQRRIDRADDWVRLEIASTLARGVRVVPVLVKGAKLTDSNQVPSELSGLISGEHRIREDHWNEDMFELVRYLDGIHPIRNRAKRLLKRNNSGEPEAYRRLRLFRRSEGYLFDDIEFGRSFFSFRRGTLLGLTRVYTQLPSARFRALLQSYSQRLEEGDARLLDDRAFKQALRKAADDMAMAKAQDQEHERTFWIQAAREAVSIGIISARGIARVVDTVADLGFMRWTQLKWEVGKKLQGTPITGVKESLWLEHLHRANTSQP